MSDQQQVEVGERPLDDAENVEEFVRNVTAWENGDDESDVTEAIKDAETVTAFLSSPPSQVGGLSSEDQERLRLIASHLLSPSHAAFLRNLAASPVSSEPGPCLAVTHDEINCSHLPPERRCKNCLPTPGLLEKLEAEIKRLRDESNDRFTEDDRRRNASIKANYLQALIDSERGGGAVSGAAEYERLVAQETLILAATEEICRVMACENESGHVTRKELADRLGESKSHVTQLLSGDRNLTLRTLADLAGALGHKVTIALVPIPVPPGEKAAATDLTLINQGGDE